MQELDDQIQSGIVRHNWSSNCENFVHYTWIKCIDVFNKVKQFQRNRKSLFDACHKIERTILTNIGKNNLYKLDDFLNEQSEELKVKE